MAPDRRQSGTIPAALSIKNAPDEVVARLRARAARNHRSLLGELLAIVEQAAKEEAPRLTIAELREEFRKLGLSPSHDSTAIIRAARDSRCGD